jgi:hypothetical protein
MAGVRSVQFRDATRGKKSRPGYSRHIVRASTRAATWSSSRRSRDLTRSEQIALHHRRRHERASKRSYGDCLAVSMAFCLGSPGRDCVRSTDCVPCSAVCAWIRCSAGRMSIRGRAISAQVRACSTLWIASGFRG